MGEKNLRNYIPKTNKSNGRKSGLKFFGEKVYSIGFSTLDSFTKFLEMKQIRSAFTLAELLVVISIVSILSTI